MDNKNIIARRVAQMLHDGEVVNLGVGIPQLVANWLPEGVELIVHAENGIIGAGGYSEEGKGDPNVVDAGGMMVDVKPGAQKTHLLAKSLLQALLVPTPPPTS